MAPVSVLLEKFLYSNLFIAIAAGLFAMEFYSVFGLDWNHSYLVFVFFVSLSHYNLHRLVGMILDQPLPYNERLEALERNVSLQLLFFLIGGLGALYLLIVKRWFLVPIFYLPMLLGLLYTLPLISIRLRDIPFLKTFIIGLTWMSIAAVIPAYLAAETHTGMWLYAFEKFAFIVALTLPFDLRDVQRDLQTHTKTFANQFGYKVVIEWSAVFFLLSQFCHYQLFLLGIYNKTLCLSLMAFNILSLTVIIVGCKKKRKDTFYIGILDGLIVLQGLIYILINNF